MNINLAEPAPAVETAVPARAFVEDESSAYAEPPMAVESAEVEPAPAVEPAMLDDDQRKMAPSSAVRWVNPCINCSCFSRWSRLWIYFV